MKIIDLSGSAFERGQIHGAAMAASIVQNVEIYRNRFLDGGISKKELMQKATEWGQRFAAHDPDYATEMEGIAKAADLPFEDIALLNARYELAYSLSTEEGAAANKILTTPEGCTAFGLLPEHTINNDTLIGQNWDWLAGLIGNMCVIRGQIDDGPAFMTVTQAGIVGGMIGLNEAGIGLCVNGLSAVNDGRNLDRRPFHIRVRDIMRCETLSDALRVILATDRTCSTNWLLAHADGEILNIETSADVANYLYPENGVITHGNHFINRQNIKSDFERISPSTLYRTPRLKRLIESRQQPWSLDQIKPLMMDHAGLPMAICRHPDPKEPETRRTATVATALLNVSSQYMEVTDGPPCESNYQRVGLRG